MRSIIITFILLAAAQVEASDLFRCEAKKDGWTVSISLQSDGEGRGTFRNEESAHSAILKIRDFQHSPKAKVPSFQMEFIPSRWEPKLGPTVSKEILPTILLITHLNGKQKPLQSVLQFLRYGQTTECVFQEFNFSELSRHHKRWELGTWGK